MEEKLEFDPDVMEMVCGDSEAYRLWTMLYQIAHFWDDLIDCDKELTNDDVNEALWVMLAELPLNRFYNEHFQALHPLIVNTCMLYKASVEYEASADEKGLEIGHVLRYSVVNIWAQIVLICGGKEHAEKVLPRLYMNAVDDRVEDYKGQYANVP